ncbi:MAG: hypothetical protein MI757_13325, partial [Pirellulales bacterium]|nr:hypothetical protein [Pirellulales bacterium]
DAGTQGHSPNDGEPRARKPMTSNERFLARRRLDTLYLTEDGQQIVHPASPTGAVVFDANAGTLAWAAWQCNNPDCPGRGADGSPMLFPWPHPLISLKADGTISLDRSSATARNFSAAEFMERKCPACLRTRNLASESAEQRAQYNAWCQPHVLPGAADRLKEL